jgi:hypothetical protein
MKTTIEIADDLLARAQRLAQQEKTTLRALTEQGLRLVLKARHMIAVDSNLLVFAHRSDAPDQEAVLGASTPIQML